MRTDTLRFRLLHPVAALWALCMPLVAAAEPRGPTVAAGSATVSGQGTRNLTINQSTQSAIINWQSFNIGGGETTRFIQPNASSVALNRVTGDRAPSSIFGSLTANGRVFLVNPEGFIFGPGAVINTAGFLATTHDIRNDDFMAGRYLFTLPGNPTASIINQGQISVADTGIAALVAPGVRNDGVITARLGRVALASANAFTLDLYGDNLINFAVSSPIASQVIDPATGKPLRNLVDNRGTLSANGGVVAMTATTARSVVDNVINNSGVIEAKSVGLKNGQIVLGAATQKAKSSGAPTQKVAISGTLDASGWATGQKGGAIRVTGEEISIASAKLDTSGDAGGGKVLIGGDYMGGHPNPLITYKYPYLMEAVSINTATNVTVAANVTVNASALTSGNGGKIVAWSDGDTTFKGTILARGGSFGGDGGLAEVSGLHSVNYAGLHVDVTAPKGLRGAILFDPAIEVIDAAKAATISDILNTGNDVLVVTTTSGYYVSPTNTAGVTETDTNVGLNIAANILKTAGGDATLTMLSGAGITVAPGIVIGSSHGKLNVELSATSIFVDSAGQNFSTVLGPIKFEAGAKIYTNGGYAVMNPGPNATPVKITQTISDTTLDDFENYVASRMHNYIFPQYAGSWGWTSTSSDLGVGTIALVIVAGARISSSVASTDPLPGITVKLDGTSFPIAFSLLNEIAKPFGITADELWQARNKLDGTNLSSFPVNIANIEPSEGPPAASTEDIHKAINLMHVFSPEYTYRAEIAFKNDPSLPGRIIKLIEHNAGAAALIERLSEKLASALADEKHGGELLGKLLGTPEIAAFISDTIASNILLNIKETINTWIVAAGY